MTQIFGFFNLEDIPSRMRASYSLIIQNYLLGTIDSCQHSTVGRTHSLRDYMHPFQTFNHSTTLRTSRSRTSGIVSAKLIATAAAATAATT